jgi:hypothetical protein
MNEQALIAETMRAQIRDVLQQDGPVDPEYLWAMTELAMRFNKHELKRLLVALAKGNPRHVKAH